MTIHHDIPRSVVSVQDFKSWASWTFRNYSEDKIDRQYGKTLSRKVVESSWETGTRDGVHMAAWYISQWFLNQTNPCSQVKKSCVLIKWRTESFDENHCHKLKMHEKCCMLSLRTSAHMTQGHLIPHKLVLKPWRQGIWFEVRIAATLIDFADLAILATV